MPSDALSDFESARELSPLQIRILRGLRDKGDGMLLDISARALSFPDEIDKPLNELREWGLVSANATKNTAFGNALFSITARGAQALRQAEGASLGNTPYRSMQTRGLDPKVTTQKQEIDLLKGLAELEERRGNLDNAAEYYKRALDANQQLSATLREGE